MHIMHPYSIIRARKYITRVFDMHELVNNIRARTPHVCTVHVCKLSSDLHVDV